MLSAIRQRVRHGELAVSDATTALELVANLPAERVALAPLLRDAFALRDRLSAFDALYVALAARRRGRIVTLDARLARGAVGLVEVVLITN